MRVRLIAAAVVLAVLASGCGGGGPSARDEVARYIEDVNAIQAKVVQPGRTVAEAGRELAKPKGDRAAAIRKLRRAALRIDALRTQVAAIPAPAEARRLRALLLELMASQAALAREVAGYVGFGPSFEAALRPLVPAGAQLKSALAAKSPVGAKAAALDAYAATIGATLRRLQGMRPPPVSTPAYETQVRTLERVQASTVALARALREQRAKELPGLLDRFQRAALGNRSLAAQRAQIAAVRAYNERVSHLDELTRRIDRERARLERTLD